MTPFYTYYFIPNLFLSIILAFAHVRPHQQKGRWLHFISFTLLGIFFSIASQYLVLIIRWFSDEEGKPLQDQLYSDTTEETSIQLREERAVKASKAKKEVLIAFTLLVVVLPLFFHIFPSKMRIVPKQYPTYYRTIVTQGDIDEILERGRKGNLYEKIQLSQDPFVRLLVEEGFIVRKEKRE